MIVGFSAVILLIFTYLLYIDAIVRLKGFVQKNKRKKERKKVVTGYISFEEAEKKHRFFLMMTFCY